MTDLKPCKECGAPAVEQIRGDMGPGDYKQVQKTDHKGHMVDDPDYYKKVHLDDANKADVRISCTKCDNATGWVHAPTKAEQPTMDSAMLATLGDATIQGVRSSWNGSN